MEILSFVSPHCCQQWARHAAFWQKPLAFFIFYHGGWVHIHIRNMFQKKRHKNIQYQGRYCNFLLLITTNSEQIFPKMASPKCAISIFGSHHWILKHTLHHQFPSLEVWPWKTISGYLNEISTKHCHTTRFRKPLTRATQLIDPEIT